MANKITDEELMLWYRRALTASRNSYKHGSKGVKFVISWWLSRDFGNTTPEINRRLDKLVKQGYLIKETCPGTYSEYYFTNKQPHHQ